jgi:hypothetical protein
MKLACVAVAMAFGFGSAQAPGPALPIDAVTAILNAFGTHDIVALGEGDHGNEQGHRFRLALVRDPRFPAIVNDIVIEGGNARYQDVMDRFVQGEDVPYAFLRQVWENTTQPAATERTTTLEFFQTVHAVNSTLSPTDSKKIENHMGATGLHVGVLQLLPSASDAPRHSFDGSTTSRLVCGALRI